MFTKRTSGWRQTAELKNFGSVATYGFGSPVAISGNTAVVSSGTNQRAGREYVFTRTATGWHQVAELKGFDTVINDGFGNSVAISGTTFVAGANGAASYAGRAYVFTKTATGWKQTLDLKGGSIFVGLGISVAISGTTIVVGAFSRGAGRAYVYTKTKGRWRQVAELKGYDTRQGDNFGRSVAVSGATIVVGAPEGAKGVGRAYIFRKISTGWYQVAELKGSDTGVPGEFGWSLAISGTTAVVDEAGEGRAFVFRA